MQRGSDERSADRIQKGRISRQRHVRFYRGGKNDPSYSASYRTQHVNQTGGWLAFVPQVSANWQKPAPNRPSFAKDRCSFGSIGRGVHPRLPSL